MVGWLMQLLVVPMVLFGFVFTCECPVAHAQAGQGMLNSSRPNTGINVWRGKTHAPPKEGHVEGAVVHVYEEGQGASRKIMARIYLYADEVQDNGKHQLKLKEKYAGELTSRVPVSGKGHGKNRDLNLVIDKEMYNNPGWRRRLLLTSSGVTPAGRTVRLVSSAYMTVDADMPPLEDGVFRTNLPGCSDYPDDAVLAEETIEDFDINGNPPPSDWMDYPMSDWETWP